MPRWNASRWSLGALALVALAVAGCGAAGNRQKLHSSSKRRLLSLVARARVDASRHDGAAVHAVLGEFVSEVRTLRTSGQLSRPTAGQLDRQARATGAQAAQQLHPATPATSTMAATTTTQPTTPAATTLPPATTTPVTSTTPSPAINSTPTQGDPRSAGTNNRVDEEQNGNCPAWNRPGRGHGHGHGHGYGHDGWPGCGHGYGGRSGGADTLTTRWSYWTGGGGD